MTAPVWGPPGRSAFKEVGGHPLEGSACSRRTGVQVEVGQEEEPSARSAASEAHIERGHDGVVDDPRCELPFVG